MLMENAATNSAAVEAAAQTAENAAAAEVVAPQGGGEEQGSPQQAGTGKEGQADNAQQLKRQSRKENARQKSIRQNAEQERISGSILNLARSKGFSPRDAGEAVRMLEAEAAGKSFQEYMREQDEAEMELENRIKASELYREAVARATENEMDAARYRSAQQMQRDLQAIRAVDPSVNSLEELGEEFKELVQTMDGLNAFYVMKGRAAVKNAAMPPAIGAVGGGTDTERDFTAEELDRLSMEDLDDPKIMERALRSLRKIK